MPLLFHPTVRIDLPAPGEWVELKAALSRGDEEKRRARLASAWQYTADGKMTGAGDVSVIVDTATLFTMQLAIVAWSFDVPVTPEAIGCLDDESYDLLKAEVQSRYPIRGRSDDDRKNSAGDGPTSNLTAAQSRRRSNGLR